MILPAAGIGTTPRPLFLSRPICILAADMNVPARILFCQCSYAQVLPAEAKLTVLQQLQEAGVAFDSVTDLCELAARRDPALTDWARGGPLKIVACHPRAVKWLFAAAHAPLPADTAQVLDLRELAAAEVIAALLGQDEPSAPEPSRPSAAAPAAEHPAWLPWFPVIDFDLCTHCMQCLSFCLFDVFGVSVDHRIEVRHPDHCKANCPACARVCPEAAILFPKHKDALINGAEASPADAPREKAKVDVSALLGGDMYSLLRQRREQARPRFSKERDPAQALAERRQCLAQLAQFKDIPPEVLASLPPPEEIQRRAQEAVAKAKAAIEQKG